jgi:hypothetical protein
MSQYLDERFESWIGRTLKDHAGHKIGKVEDIYTDDDTGQPEWLTVTTGLFGSDVSFVPVAGATPLGDDELQVQFPKEQVKEAPNAGSDGRLSPEEEARLYAHYGFDYDQERIRLQRWAGHHRPGTAPMGPTQVGDERMEHDPMAAREPVLEPKDDERLLPREEASSASRPASRAWDDDDDQDLRSPTAGSTRSTPGGADRSGGPEVPGLRPARVNRPKAT